MAAEHFIPHRRDQVRNAELRAALRDLWGGRESVEVRRCQDCGFGFACPFVAGDARFYNLVSGSDPHYPQRRWEFSRTMNAMADADVPSGRLLECGAGDGAFLKQLHASEFGARFEAVAIEYDDGAIERLRAAGFRAERASITDLAHRPPTAGFAIVCMFQTLEHMSDIHGAFRAFKSLLRPGGHAFISVPHGLSVEAQERLTGFWDMPPNHVGRWLPISFQRMAGQHDLELVACEIQPLSRIADAWRLAVYSVNSAAYRRETLAARLVAIRFRYARGPLKRLLALLCMPALLPRIPDSGGHSLWVHLRRPVPAARISPEPPT
jgi:SAM-dependent methyltransferase